MTEAECVSIPGLTSRDKRAIRTAFTRAEKAGVPCKYEECTTVREVLLTLPGIKIYNQKTGKYEIQPRIETFDSNNLEILDSELLDDDTAREIVDHNLYADSIDEMRQQRMSAFLFTPNARSEFEQESARALKAIKKLLWKLTIEDLQSIPMEYNSALKAAAEDEIKYTEAIIDQKKKYLEQLKNSDDLKMLNGEDISSPAIIDDSVFPY